MSGYAALVSLLRNLGDIVDAGGLCNMNIHNRAQLHSLRQKVIFFLDFLDNSSSCKATQISAALETRMREAAYKAEDLIESQISGIFVSDDRRFRVLMIMTLVNFFYSFVILRDRIHVGFPQVIPDWIKIFIARNLIPALAAIVICTFLAVALNLALQGSNFSDNYGSQAQEAQDLRVVLYDLNLIVKEMIRIKEARGDLEISAHASLLSLRKILDSILESGGLKVYHNRPQLKSLHEKVTFLLDFLGNASANNYMAHQKPVLEAKIRDAVYKAQQLIEFQIPAQFILDSDRTSFLKFMKFMLLAVVSSISASAILTTTPVSPQVSWAITVALGFGTLALGRRLARVEVSTAINNSETHENQELCLIIDDLSVIMEEVNKIKDACGNLSTLPVAAAASSSSSRRDLRGIGKNVVVGLGRDMEEIKARLSQESSEREVISIVGMGGIGKTTLAAHVYNDLDIAYFFDIRAWVTISQGYSLRHVLLALLDSAKILTEEKHEDINDEKLALYLHKYLMYRRYLIVIDDVWDTEIWDFLSRFFPENYNGSRVLITSRLSHVASYPDSDKLFHRMQCLNDNDSWELLRTKVFGEEDCPLDLESIGREIATTCRGLPLAILVIGGLLYQDKRSEIWREVAENLNLTLRQVEEHYLEILGLSYDHLPYHLRPCFLYMGVFLGDSEILVSRLIRLWAAEGFLKPCTSKSLEEVAEDYLKDLIDRNLILICKRSCNGKVRTCSIHDLLRDVCVENARKENFFLVMDDGERPEQAPRRLSIRFDALLPLQANFRHDLTSCYHYVRSFLCTASKLLDNQSGLNIGFIYLRVLDVLVVHFGEFPYQIIKLVHLRYLAFHYDGQLPSSMFKLHNLQTIVHHHCSLNKYPLLPRVIWSMPNLRHLYVKPGCYLSDPLGYRLSWKSSILEHLQTLMGIRNFKWSKGIIRKFPNLKKLGISYYVSSSVDWSAYQLESLVDLHQLESLQIIIKYNGVGLAVSHDPPKLAFPLKLKKLSISGGGIPWASIGGLPNLEALKLRREACSGSSWETVEGEFPELILLLMEEISFTRWETDETHFPRLQRLVIRSCGMLEEIPSAIGDIPTLEMIELVDCHPSAVDSANQIQEEQESMGNEELKVCVTQSSHVP